MTNSYDQDGAAAIVDEIERKYAEMESSKGSHANFCKQRRGEIKDILKDAKDERLSEGNDHDAVERP